MVCSPNDRVLVLDHHHGIAQVTQTIEHLDEPFGIEGVQANAGLVQNVCAAHQAAAQAGAQLNALAFAATQGGRSRG